MELVLTRNEIKNLNKLRNEFRDVDKFTIDTQNKSGIGTSVHVIFTVTKLQHTIDITDYESW